MNRFTPICAKQHLVASFWRPDYRADRTPVEVIVIPTPAGGRREHRRSSRFSEHFFGGVLRLTPLRYGKRT